MRSMPSAITAAAVVWITAIAGASPASAVERGVVYDGDDPGPGYTPLEALGLFVGIPALSILLIALAVYAPGWVKGSGESTEAPTDPVWLSSPSGAASAPSGPGMITPGGPTDHEERGGASARW